LGSYPLASGRRFESCLRNQVNPAFGGIFCFIFEIMFTVYVLYSPSHNKIYIGFTSNIEQRMISHNQLATKGYTVKFRPWTLIHTEVFETKCEAMKREIELKSANGRQFIWNLIKNKAN